MKDLEHKYKVAVNRVADLTAENERLRDDNRDLVLAAKDYGDARLAAESRLAATEQALTVKARQYETAFRERAEAEAENERLRTRVETLRCTSMVAQVERERDAAEARLATAERLLKQYRVYQQASEEMQERDAARTEAEQAELDAREGIEPGALQRLIHRDGNRLVVEWAVAELARREAAK